MIGLVVDHLELVVGDGVDQLLTRPVVELVPDLLPALGGD
jgi:hypothetical protein